MAPPKLIMKMKLAKRTKDLGNVTVFELKHPSRPELPQFEAGAHIDLHLPTGAIRQYSLINSPLDRSCYTIAVKREEQSRGGSQWLHEHLHENDEIPVSSPRNHFCLNEHADNHILIAGGIGITPLYAMAKELVREQRQFVLHYFSRSRTETPLLETIAHEIPAENLVLHMDDECNTKENLAQLLKKQKNGSNLYYCGPPGFMGSIFTLSSHWDENSVHCEAFKPDLDPDFIPEEFTIQISSSGKQIVVPQDMTALAALKASGMTLPSACENGVCGTCECGLMEGKPIHRDSILTLKQKQNRFIPCISRATGTIILDL